MKRIGIITYTKSPNYGAALQLFATYHAFRKINVFPEVVNYTNEFEGNQQSIPYLIRNGHIKDALRIAVAGYIFQSKKLGKDNFEEFYQEMKYSMPIKNIDDIERLSYDIYCIGSDQVWNPKITNGYDDVFFLNTDSKINKISYASSFGNLSNVTDSVFVAEALKSFNRISVREKNAEEFLRSVGINNVKTVVDPTLLFDEQEWACFCKKEYLDYDNYLLIYAIGGEFNRLLNVASPLAERYNLKTMALTLSTRKKKVDYIVNTADPLDFVALIRNAKFVVTNSFHGLCFSVINKTPFLSVKYRPNPDRAENLLSRYNLMHRFYDDGNIIEDGIIESYDLLKSEEILSKDREESWQWLNEAISNV